MRSSERRPAGAPSESPALVTTPSLKRIATTPLRPANWAALASKEAAQASPTDAKSSSTAPLGRRFQEFAINQSIVFAGTDGRVYGALADQPHLALSIAGSDGIVQQLAGRFHAETLDWPGTKVRAEVEDYLKGRAHGGVPRKVFQRSAWIPTQGRLYLDTGNHQGSVVEVDADGWRRQKTAPCVFRRPRTADELVIAPDRVDREAALSLLRELVPVKDEDLPLVLALLLTTWFTGIPQPIVLITGPADSGKTTMARFLTSLMDPVTHSRGGGLPRDEAGWKALATTARVLLIDNAGHITAAVSDLLCRVSTGGELTTRTKYTDDTAHVTDLQAPLWLTSIDAGVLREDLASRMVTISIVPMQASTRLSESALAKRFDAARPILRRMLLHLMSEVLKRLPGQPEDGLTHRMGDFEQILRCVDDILGTDGGTRLAAQALELGEDVLEADPIAQAVLAGVAYTIRDEEEEAGFVKRNLLRSWAPTELLKMVTAHATEAARRSSAWPRSAGVLTSHLNRIAPTLEKVHGVRVTTGIRHGKDRHRRTLIERIQPGEPTA